MSPVASWVHQLDHEEDSLDHENNYHDHEIDDDEKNYDDDLTLAYLLSGSVKSLTPGQRDLLNKPAYNL